jgi:SAM-dependent MidA family methyltransferase
MNASVPLPPLSAPELEHSSRLVSRIRSEIEANDGWISFARFMEMALYEPGLGYYSAGATKFGAQGDFVTAPEISPLFSRCLARQCAEVLGSLGGGSVLEIGAGSGTMAADVLNELASLELLPERYYILEVSADLRERQLATIAAHAARHLSRVEWLEAPPEQLSGVVLANEVLDAIPVDCFRIRSRAVNALGVSWHLDHLDWSEIRARGELARHVRALERQLEARFPDGYTSEVNLRVGPWVKSLARMLTTGVMLFIDYGLPRRQYYRPERAAGTLLCHFRHRYHDDPFFAVGLQDIGAWVDFTAVAEAAVDAQLDVAGFTTQAHFLMSLGIDRMLMQADQQELVDRVSLARQAMMLTLPGEMGERFKVLALSNGITGRLSGFALRDLAVSL